MIRKAHTLTGIVLVTVLAYAAVGRAVKELAAVLGGPADVV